MLEIKFLNVNQGDSIIIHWDKGQVLGTIILDCHLTAEGNRTIEYIKKKEIREIDYIILSHSHFDHYSGLSQLLSFCKLTGVKIGYFLFTGKVQPEYIRKISKASPQAASAINELFNKVIDYSNEGGFELNSLEAGPNCDIRLNDIITLTVLSPTSFEEQQFIKSIKIESFANSDVKNHPAANWLSTVLKIHTKDWYILLTGDCYKETLIRLDTKKKLIDTNCKLKIAQSAHHGAGISHNNTFWSKRNKDSDSKVVFSVGENIYKHPSDNVVSYFEENLFEIRSTNDIGALKTIQSKLPLKNKINHLSTFSAKTVNQSYSSNFYGDQSFIIDDTGRFI